MTQLDLAFSPESRARPDWDVCKQFFKGGCDKCPIYTPCIVRAPVGILTMERIEANIAEKIVAAEKYLSAANEGKA